MGDHPPYPTVGNGIANVGKETAQTQVPVKKYDAVHRHFKPETADSFPISGDLHKKRRNLASAKSTKLPARIHIPVQGHTLVENHQQVDVGTRNFTTTCKGTKKDEPFNVTRPGVDHTRGKVLQERRPSRVAGAKRKRAGSS